MTTVRALRALARLLLSAILIDGAGPLRDPGPRAKTVEWMNLREAKGLLRVASAGEARA